MEVPASNRVSTRSSKEIPLATPRWSFWKGILTGAAIEVPILAVTVWLLARMGIGDPDVGFMRIMRLTAVFAGIAALFTAGGVGRLAAYAAVERGREVPGEARGRAMFVAARAHAAASAGLVLIAAIPHGHLPEHFGVGWLVIPLAGVPAGLLCGAVIGFVCGGVTPVGISDVLSLAQPAGDAMKSLLDPRDLVKLGSVLRKRTTTLFEGMFDPAPKAPEDPEKPPPEKPK